MPPRKRRKLNETISCNVKMPSTNRILPVKEESTQYNMNYSHRGYALIFHHFTFSPHLKHLRHREGSEVDLERLQEVLKSLDFQVEVYEDQTALEIKQIINMTRNADHSECDCLIVVVLTHGKANSVLYAKDTTYCLQELWNPFMAKECPTLVGKPKIFFIQACRGKKVDSGLQVGNKMDVQGQQVIECDAYTKPNGPDFLIVYSSVEGYGSFRNTRTGSWFIQSLCERLETLGPHVDLLTITTRTANCVALDYDTGHDQDEAMNLKKQVPHVHSTLTKDIYFRPKNTDQQVAKKTTKEDKHTEIDLEKSYDEEDRVI